MDYISKARAFAVKRLPYMSHLIYYLRPFATDKIPIAGVSKSGIMYYNPEVCSKMTPKDLAFVIIHEAMHILQDTHGRRQNRDPSKWNIASDISINDLIENCGITPPELGLMLPRRFKLPRFKSSEYYYEHIPITTEYIFYDVRDGDALEGEGEGIEEGEGEAKGEEKKDKSKECSCGKKRSAEETDMARRSCALDIKKHSEQHGNVPSEMLREVEDLFAPPKKDWKSIFRRKIRHSITQATSGKYDYSYKKLSRRESPIVSPGLIGYEAKLGILFDTSGSMDVELLNECMGQVKHVAKQFKEIWFISIDTQVHTCVKIRNPKELFKTGNVRGGGGTILDPGFEELTRKGVDVCLAVSDCYASFGEKPKFPVVWMCKAGQHGQPPWGEVIEIE